MVKAKIRRPFEQGAYNKKLLRTEFSEFNYRFRVLLPVSEYTLGSSKPPRPVFLSRDLRKLERLFREDFGGLTIPTIMPSAVGQYLRGTTKRAVANQHAVYEIYSL